MEQLFDQPSTQNDAGTTQSPDASVHQYHTREFPSVVRVTSQTNEGATQSTNSLKFQPLPTGSEVTEPTSSESTSSSISPVTVKEPGAEKQIQAVPVTTSSHNLVVVKARGRDGYFIYDHDKRYRNAVRHVMDSQEGDCSNSLTESCRLAQELYDRCMDLEKESNSPSVTQNLDANLSAGVTQRQIGGRTVTIIPPKIASELFPSSRMIEAGLEPFRTDDRKAPAALPKQQAKAACSVLKDEPQLWESVGRTREQFLALPPDEQGSLEYLHKTELRKLISEASKKKLDSLPDLEPPLRGDPAAAERLMINLIRGFNQDGVDRLVDLLMEQEESKIGVTYYPDNSCHAFESSTYYRELVEAIKEPEKVFYSGHSTKRARHQQETQKCYNHFSEMAMAKLDDMCEKVLCSAFSTIQLDDLEQAAERVVKQDQQDGARTALEEFKRRLKLAKIILAPDQQEGNDIWFRAMVIANSSLRGLGKSSMKPVLMFRSSYKVRKCYLQAIAGLLLISSREQQEPNWNLIVQLIKDAHSEFRNDQLSYQSFATLIAKALARCDNAMDQLIGDSRAQPVQDDSGNPIEALVGLLRRVDRTSLLKLNPDDDSLFDVILLLQRTEDLAAELRLMILNYKDAATNLVQRPHFFSKDCGPEQLKHRLKTDFAYFCRKAEWQVTTDCGNRSLYSHWSKHQDKSKTKK